MRVLIGYDIADDDARARVAAHLGRVGVRVQRSLFDCDVESNELQDLVALLEQLIDVDRDVVDIFGSCSSCEDQRWHVGQSRAAVLGALWWVV